MSLPAKYPWGVSEGAVCRFMEPMSSHTTFRIGGPAEAYVCPGNEDELGKVICMCREHDIPWSVLGNGSNLLVSDRGIKGVVIAMEETGVMPGQREALYVRGQVNCWAVWPVWPWTTA